VNAERMALIPVGHSCGRGYRSSKQHYNRSDAQTALLRPIANGSAQQMLYEQDRKIEMMEKQHVFRPIAEQKETCEAVDAKICTVTWLKSVSDSTCRFFSIVF
jgi:hypothetical protein